MNKDKIILDLCGGTGAWRWQGMKKFKGLMTSLSCEWATPQWLFDKLNEEFSFTVDVCAKFENAKVGVFFSKEVDGLKEDWNIYPVNICWMNPPYGREIVKWVEKAYNESLKGTTVVCLLPARPDTRWWHDYVMKAKEIRFIKGRLKFGGAKNSAPFPSCVVVF